jgi:hypothetical protein
MRPQGDSAVIAIYNQARNELAAGSYIVPAFSSVLGPAMVRASAQSAAAYIQANAGNTTALALLTQAPSTITGYAYSLDNLHPYNVPVVRRVAPLRGTGVAADPPRRISSSIGDGRHARRPHLPRHPGLHPDDGPFRRPRGCRVRPLSLSRAAFDGAERLFLSRFTPGRTSPPSRTSRSAASCRSSSIFLCRSSLRC